MSKPITNKKVLIIYAEEDNGHDIIIESCQQFIALAGMSSEKRLYQNIVPPPDKVVRYPREEGEEWEVGPIKEKQSQEDKRKEKELRFKLSSFDSYIFISLSDKTAGLALWALTLRGAVNIYGNKPVIVIDPTKLLQDNALPDIFKLLNDSRDSGIERIVSPKDANISNLFDKLMNEVSHANKNGASKTNKIPSQIEPSLPECIAEPEDLPQYLKTIYLLVADDKLADKEKYLKRFAGILKTAANHIDAMRGWSIEVRGETDAKKVLQHVQLRPVDLILLDCDFQGTSDGTEWDAEKPVGVDEFMFDGRYVGLQLYKYLKRTKVAKVATIDEVKKSPVINFDTVLFTSYKIETIERKKKDPDIGELTDISIGNNGELISYLQKENHHALKWILAKLIQAKNNIISLWVSRTSPTNTPQYELAFRYFGFKFAHHDWLPLDMHCIPINVDERNSYKNELFRMPGWIVLKDKPENNKNGLCFSFPTSNTENLKTAHTYAGVTIAKVLNNFIKLLSDYRERATEGKITIHNSDDCDIPFDKAYDVARKQISCNPPKKVEPSSIFGNECFASPLWLAAVPLTGSTMPGDWDKVRSHFISKIECYLEMGFGAAVLKTVYPVSESKGTWPDKSMYQENQSRCYKYGKSDKATFYNTGSTANEAFSPTLFNDVLNCFGGNPQIITSLGAHENDKDVWHTLFSEVFNKIDTAWYPLVEINVRHALRTISQKCGLNGDEYFHPLTNDPVQALARLPEFYRAFREWVVTVASIANEHSKKLIFKFTYRTDLFVLLGICEELKKTHKNIVGVTLINTFKSPSFLDPKESGPDMKMDGWFDIIKHPQVSGAALAPLRNYLLDVLQDKAFTPNGFTLDISASGGVMSKDDVSQCLALGAKSVQIGTALLQGINDTKDGKKYNLPQYMADIIKATEGASPGSELAHENIYKRNRDVAVTVSGPGGKFAFERFVKRRVYFEIARCTRCGICYSSTYCDTYLNRLYINDDKLTEIDSANFYNLKYPVIYEDACVGCGLCVQLCPNGALNLVIPKDGSTFGGGLIENNGTIAHFRGKQKNPMRLVLASSSPRRIQILKELGYEFHSITPTFIEKTQEEIQSADELVKINAEGKALEIANLLLCGSTNELDKQWQNDKSLKALRKISDRCVVVACDTLIVLREGENEEVIGKPHDAGTAIKTLTKLSGKIHQVITGICVINCAQKDSLLPISDLVETKVTFRTLDKEQIKKYVETGEPLDKAGAYAIQGRGELFIEKIEGSYSNVVGLPKERLEDMLMGILFRQLN